MKYSPDAKLLVKHLQFGNTKLPKSTMIFNMGPAHNCPSDKLGLCQCSKECYAKKAERQYKTTCPQYRQRQADIWLSWSAERFISAFLEIAANRPNVDKLRFNESGDFYSQSCINKLQAISAALDSVDITTYGYTARHDLQFNETTFVVRGSGLPINGISYVAVKTPSGNHFVCPGSCKTCSACLSKKVAVIESVIH